MSTWRPTAPSDLAELNESELTELDREMEARWKQWQQQHTRKSEPSYLVVLAALFVAGVFLAFKFFGG